MDIATVEERYLELESCFGRHYQAYALLLQISLSPTDEQEGHRQRQQHLLLKELWSDWPEHKLFPHFIGQPKKILDCGFGTAVWAFEAAALDCTETIDGIDITPHLAPRVGPTNLRLQIGDLNEKTSFNDRTFDLVNSRFVANGIGRFRWPSYLSDIYRILGVGGWIQIIEWELDFRSNNGQSEQLTALQEWVRLYTLALDASGYPEGKKSISIAQDCGAWLRTARFERVQTAFKEVPTCGWSTDARWRRIGEKNLEIMRQLIDSLATYPVVARGIQTIEEFTRICSQAKEELAKESAEPFLRLYACWGRKEASTDEG